MPIPTTPLCTVDIIIELPQHPKSRAGHPAVVLIERKYAPLGWAIPGGFVDLGEPLALAARREAKEETSLDVVLREQFFSYSQPDRDPRRHTVSTVFIAEAQGLPQAADDAKHLAVFCEEDLPPMAFDHGQILADYFAFRRTGQRPLPDR
jgi:8-oxo-dGTP diphosphatase